MDHEFRFTAVKIAKRIELVKARRFRAEAAFEPFRLRVLDGVDAAPDLCGPAHGWPEVKPGDYWCGADTHFCLRSRVTVPGGWTAPALNLPFGSVGDIFNHPEAVVYFDGEVIGSADRHHHTIVLDELEAGIHEIALHGWTGLAGWPPRQDAPERLLMRQCAAVDRDEILDDFLILAEAALETANLLQASTPERIGILDALDAAFVVLDTRAPLGAALHHSAPNALEVLREGLAKAGAPLDTTLNGIGHAHMDIAYLWTVAESRAKNLRTYTNVLRLMDRHPDFHFTHSQPQLYEFFKADHPALFAEIKSKVASGQWEPIGGMWVEPDTNIPGAEALVRQILLGRTWFRDEFGEAETPMLWLPDTFGFSWCLPQLMKLSGLEMLVTNKLNWNQHTQMPSSTTWWEGMDGSRVLLHVLTTPRRVQHLPFPTNYKSDLSGAEVLGTTTRSTQPALTNLPICFGFGDGGGGPTEDLIARARAFADMPGMPRMRMGRASGTLDAVNAIANDLPVYRDELYVEGHRGVLTSQAWLKRANRQAEAALHRAELIAVMAGQNAQREDLTAAWKLLCLNQFHDTISGTAITQVFDDARKDFDQIFKICRNVEDDLLPNSGGALCALNPSPLPRHSLAYIKGEIPEGANGQQVDGGALLDLPAMDGYEVVEIGAASPKADLIIAEIGDAFVLENDHLRAEVGPDGAFARVFDKVSSRDLLQEGQRGNQLWAYEDRPLSWDAWDIDPFFEDRGEEITDVQSIRIVEDGPLRVALRIERRYGNSKIRQDICLTDRSARLELATEIDWRDEHILLKAIFPLSINPPSAHYDIQWGQIARPTTRETRRDASRFEVCGQKWAAFHDGDFAVALLNDGKYGHEAKGHELRLTLLKSSTMPDPLADQGLHIFTYALLPQTGPGFEVIRAEAEALNHPLLIAPGLSSMDQVASVKPSNVVLETVKPSEEGRGFILRLYEAEGVSTTARVSFGKLAKTVHLVDLLEDQQETLSLKDNGIDIQLAPFQIVSLLVVPAGAA